MTTSSNDELRQIAAALDATPKLVPYLAELLTDLWDLGSSPDLVKDWLRELALPAQTKVLDLGCGKGAISLTLARDLGFKVHGIDLFEPFILDARARASEWGLDHLCRFEQGDLKQALQSATGYDVVVYASVGALGRLDHTVARLRQTVGRGGYMVIDEGFLAPGVDPQPGFGTLVPHAETNRLLTSHGDEILHERTMDPAEMRALDERYIESISTRAEELAAAHPGDADLIRSYIDRQQAAAAAWERSAISAAWLVQRKR
jgi:SAM-dependent methyltransferase